MFQWKYSGEGIWQHPDGSTILHPDTNAGYVLTVPSQNFKSPELRRFTDALKAHEDFQVPLELNTDAP